MARIREFDGELDELDEPRIVEFTGTLDEEPGALDNLYRKANRIFGRGSVMDEADGRPGRQDPVAKAIAEKIGREYRAERAPAVARSNVRMVEGPAGMAEVAVRRGVGGLIEALGGAARGAGDAYNIDALARTGADLAESGTRFAQRAQLRQGHVPGFGPESVVHELPQAAANAGASILQTAPSLLANVVLPGSGLPLLFAQTGAQEYGQGREAGLNPAGAVLRAIPQGVAEVVGEKVGGFDALTKGIREAITDNAVEQFGRTLIKSGWRELPGEELTTTLQFLTDKAPGIGINQEATLADYTKAVKDTALATLLQSGAMTGGGAVLERAAKMADAANNPVSGLYGKPQQEEPGQKETGRDISELADAIAKTANIPSANIVEAPDDIELDPVPGQEAGQQAGQEQAQAETPMPPAPPPAVDNPDANTGTNFEKLVPEQNQAQTVPENIEAHNIPTPEKPRPAYQVPLLVSPNAMQVDTPTEGLRPGDVIGIDGAPFATKAKADKAKKDAGKGWAVKRANGGFVVRYQPQTDAQKKALQGRLKKQASIDTERDSMFAAIAKLGGINAEEVKSEWGFSDDLRGLRGAGIKRVATTTGHSIDTMGEMLAEQGYLSVDENGKYDRHEFEDLFGGELAGHAHYTPEGFERMAEQMQQERDAEFEDGLSEEDIADSGFDNLPDGMKDAAEGYLSDYEESDDELEARLEREAIQALAAEEAASLGPGGGLEQAAGRAEPDTGRKGAGDANAGETVARAPQEPGEDAGAAAESITPPQPEPEPEPEPDSETEATEPREEPRPLAAREPGAARAKIEDFGEVLRGARKEYAAAYRDAMGKSKDVDIAAAPLSKSWPEPDYQKLLDDGADPWIVAFVRSARDEIPTKPQKSWKQAQWVKEVKLLRDMSYQLLDGSIPKERLQSELDKPGFTRLQEHLLGRVALYEAVGHEKSLKGIRITSHAYSLYKGVEYNPSKVFWIVEKEAKATAFGNWPRELGVGETREEALEEFKRRYASLDTGKATAKDIQFDIYSKRGRQGFFIGKKVGKNYIDLKFFEDLKEARAYLKDHQAELVALLEQKKEIPNERRDLNLPRIGADHRGGIDVTPQLFSETFGFRGVQFGNYVEGARRQQDLNDAFDALMDMAGILGIPPKAISLNGELGLAFGARGTGGKHPAKAHYEGGEVVINLTKNQGAGSLAHEWWHALDNYFSRMRGAKGDYMTEALDVSLAARGGDYHIKDPRANHGVRREMVAAYGEVLKAINATALAERSKNLDSRRSKDYWSTKLEMTARAFESYIINRLKDQGQSNDYLANIVAKEDYALEDSYPYPTAAEIPAIRAAYDHFFQTIEAKETESGVVLFSAQSTATEGETAEAVRAAIAEDTYNHEVDVYATLADAPEYVQQQAKKERITPEGFYDPRTGRVAIIASNVTLERAVEVARHELIGHYGLENMVGADEMRRLAARVIKAEADGNKAIIEAAKHVDRTQPGLSPERRAKEIIAVMAERNMQNSIVRRVMDAIRKFLKSIGFTKGDITDAEIAALLRDTQAYLREQGREMVAGEAALAAFSPVYHGTPHVWPPEPGFPHGRPRLDKIGTGESAAAYGWGWYSAENPGVASSYRSKLATTTRAHVAFDGQKLTPKLLKELQDSPDKDIADFFKYELPPKFHGTSKKVLAWIDERIASEKEQQARFEKRAEESAKANDVAYATHSAEQYREYAQQHKNRAQRLEKVRALYAAIPERLNGALYKLDIPDPVLPYLLDWDKPLSAQTPEVQKALEKLSDKMIDAWRSNGSWPHIKGETLYRHLADGLTVAAGREGKHKAASEKLASIGIVGNRYLDALSRGRKDGTYNFVIWDQPTLDKIALLSRNGEKLDAIREAEFSAGLFDQEPTALEAGRPLTRAEVLDKQAKEERLAKEEAKPEKKKKEPGKELRGDQVDLFNTQSSLFSGKEPASQDTIEVDGTLYPATNSDGERIYPTDEGIRNFWRWFNGFRHGRVEAKDASGKDGRRAGGADNGTAGQTITRDERGRPRVFYHGTKDRIRAFDLNHKNRKDKGWLGRGVYLMDSHAGADVYAHNKPGPYSPIVMPLYAAVHNPYVASLALKQKLRHAPQEVIDEFTAHLKELGHDGVILKLPEGTSELVVFDPKAVKSPDNSGDFGPTDEIHFSAKKPEPEPHPQQNLELEVDPITGKDFFRTERDTAGRRRYVAGRKIYDGIARKAIAVLDKVKLADNAPENFKAMMRNYRVDMAKAQANAEQVAKIGLEKLTAAERKMLSDVIEGNLAPTDLPPETVLRIATEIQTALRQQGQDLVELGMLTEDRLIEQYLPRVYRNPLLARFTNKAIFLSWYQKARMRISGARLKSRGLIHEIRPSEWQQYRSIGWKLSSMADGSEIPADLREAMMKGTKLPPHYPANVKFLVWRDFTREEREQMGEIHDGLLRYALGYVETQRDIAIGRLFKAVASDQSLASKINPGGWAKVPDELIIGADGVKRFGALSGMYVPEMVRDMIERSTQAKGPLMQVYDRALNFWKEGKTIWNPVSHGNNIISNVFTIHFAGLNPANPRHWRRTIQQYRKQGNYYQEAINHGLFGTEWASKDIQDLFLPELVGGELSVENISASRFNKVINFLKKTGKPVAWYRDRMQRAYEFEDQFFKLMLFIDRREGGASIPDAINDVERYVFNYADVPEGVETLKRTYSPFIAYTYKALPMLVHTAMTRPDRLIAPIALLGGANWLAYALMGGDEDEERKNMPEYLKGRTAIGTPKAIRMPFDVEGKPAYMDMTRRVPLGDLFDMNNQTGGIAAPAPMMPSHPLFTAAAALFFNKDTFTGKDITKPSDTDWETAQKRADWIYKQIIPNAPFIPGSWNFDKLMNGAAYAFDTDMAGYTGYTKSGDAIPLALALLDVAGGTKIRASDPARNKDFREYELDRERKEIMANIRSAQRNKAMTPEKRGDYIERQREKLQEVTRRRQELN